MHAFREKVYGTRNSMLMKNINQREKREKDCLPNIRSWIA